MKFSAFALAAIICFQSAAGEFFIKEDFNDSDWKSVLARWTESSTWKSKAEMGTWKHTAGEWHGDSDDKGIQTTQDARFYGLSAKLDKPFVSGDKPLVIQYSVKHEQNLDCGGAYIKLLPGDDKFDAAAFGGDTPYAVMFGPDVCGSSNKKTHVILHDHKKDETYSSRKKSVQKRMI
jgi:calreticulin